MVELLAPAGDLPKIKFAFHYGADAVYFAGQDYSLRANAKNFKKDEIKKACEYAHQLHKKVYVTVNIVFHDEDLAGLKDYLIYLDTIKVDGLICSDIVVLKLIHELKIKSKVILSTQASILNYQAARFYEKLGVKQVVVAREAMREDIIKIKENTNLEIECFIHGAMCSSISGKCILSNYVTGRDSNRGGCAQICRWVFNDDEKYPLTITPKDLMQLDYLEDMIKIGVNTFKVEGRMRSIYYIATVILCYRRMIDSVLSGSLTEEKKAYYAKVLNRCANRDGAAQFYYHLPTEKEQYFNLRDEQSNQDFLGLIIDYDPVTKLATIEERNLFRKGQIVEIIGPNHETFTTTINIIYDENNTEIEVANKPKMLIKVPFDLDIEKDDLLRVKI